MTSTSVAHREVTTIGDISPWLTLAQGAEYLGITEHTLRDYVRRGQVPASRLNGGPGRGARLIRIRLSDLDRVFEPIPATGGDGS